MKCRIVRIGEHIKYKTDDFNIQLNKTEDIELKLLTNFVVKILLNIFIF
ncbi:MAG: hypothetical protein WKF85_00975 [Chitinophagaceae bacterium]